jgi:hypothetical protein
MDTACPNFTFVANFNSISNGLGKAADASGAVINELLTIAIVKMRAMAEIDII